MIDVITSALQRVVPQLWLQAIILILLFVLFAKLIQIFIDKVITRIAKKTETTVDDKIIERTRKPVFYLILFMGLRAAIGIAELGDATGNIVEMVSAVFFLYIIGTIITVALHSWGTAFAEKTKTRTDETLIPIVIKTIKILFVVIGIIWILDIWQINITPYLAGLGISGIVVGLALQDSLKNIFGGVSLILDRNFNVGDKVKLESGELGEIMDIGLRSTKLRTYDNETIFIPNGQMANMRIHNFVQPNPRVRVVVPFGVEYGTAVGRVQKVVLAALKTMKDISNKPYMDVIFIEMADSAIKFQARFWVEDYKIAFDKKNEATKKIYNALNKDGIGIPFPTRTVHIVHED